MVEFKLQKNADEQTKHLIFGFTRDIKQLLPRNNSYYNIPHLANFIIITYYYNPEYFGIHGKRIRISENKLTAISDKNLTDTVYGNYTIECYENGIPNTKTYEWKFRINKCYFIAIGIDEATAKFVNTYFYSRDTKNYAFTSSGDIYTKRSMMPKKAKTLNRFKQPGTEVMMQLNMKTRELNYYLNNETIPSAQILDVVVAKDLEYKLAVFLWGSAGMDSDGSLGRPSAITLQEFTVHYK